MAYKIKYKKEKKFIYSKDGYANSSIMAVKTREYIKKGYSKKQAEEKAYKWIDKQSSLKIAFYPLLGK